MLRRTRNSKRPRKKQPPSSPPPKVTPVLSRYISLVGDRGLYERKTLVPLTASASRLRFSHPPTPLYLGVTFLCCLYYISACRARVGDAGAWGGELQQLDYPLYVLSLLSVPVPLCVIVLPPWGVVLAALAVLFGVCHNRVWLYVRAYLPAYAANDALAPLVETSLVLDPHSTHCNCFRGSGRGLVSPTSVRYHLIVVWVVVSVLVCLP